MPDSLEHIIGSYDPGKSVEFASTIPSAWYTDCGVCSHERETVFAHNWLAVGRVNQLASPGSFITTQIGGEPIVVVRGQDDVLRAFFNVCRHHAAAVMTADEGSASTLRCPYHGWTYALDGTLKGVPEFDEVCEFQKADNGLIPLNVATWEQFVFVRIATDGPELKEFIGDMVPGVAKLDVGTLQFVERQTYDINCNWKVFVDNFLDGGYHVPHIHKGLGSVLNYQDYTIENGERFCLQSSPVVTQGGDADVAAVRGGEMAYYYWLYPNFMLNWYEGYMDTNVVLPLGVDRCRVIFDFFFDSGTVDERSQSVAVADVVQQEDIDVCESVQRGLHSRAYDTGRLSVRREAGEHLFHWLLYKDLTTNG